jgi:hypothetical protein
MDLMPSRRTRHAKQACVVDCHSTMGSNSLRVSTDLFLRASRQGEALSRSTAQQLEHWARLGAAVEASGMTVAELVSLLQGTRDEARTPPHAIPEAGLWARKRAQQQRDITSIEQGQVTNASLSWFSGGRARRAKVKNSPL